MTAKNANVLKRQLQELGIISPDARIKSIIYHYSSVMKYETVMTCPSKTLLKSLQNITC